MSYGATLDVRWRCRRCPLEDTFPPCLWITFSSILYLCQRVESQVSGQSKRIKYRLVENESDGIPP